MSLEVIDFKPLTLFGVEDSHTSLIINGVESPTGVSGAAELHEMFRDRLAEDFDVIHPLFGLYWKHQSDGYFLGTYANPSYLHSRLGTEIQSEAVPSGKYVKSGMHNWQKFLETNGPDRFGSFVSSIAQSQEAEVEKSTFKRDKSRPEIEIYQNRTLGELTVLFPVQS